MRKGPMSMFNRYWERWLLVALLSLAVLLAQAQILDEDHLRKVNPGAHAGAITCLEPMSDGHTLVAGCGDNGGLLFIDTATWTITRQIPLNGFKDGPRIRASRDGRLLLLKELWRFTYEGKDDMQGTHMVIDAHTGATVVDAGKGMDASMSADGRVLAVLDGGRVTVHALPSGKELHVFDVAQATNAVAVSPDGQLIAVSHRPTEEQLATVPSMRADKKAQKAGLKYRQMVSFFNATSGTLVHTVTEVYDVIRGMGFTPDGSRVLVYSSQDPRLAPPQDAKSVLNLNMVDRPGYVQQIDAVTFEPLRAGFQSLMNEPYLAVSPDGRTLALSSTEGHNKRKLTLYDLDSGDTHLLINLEQKHRYDTGETEQHDGRVAYAWLSDGRLVVALGGDLGIHTP
jgi:WD40 repeat protein